MKKQIVRLLVAITMSTTVAYAKHATPPDRLTQALIQVESRGNDHAVGDKHLTDKAYGVLQIRKPCLDDVNNRYGTKHSPQDMLGNRSLSVWVCHKYLEMYATQKRLGRVPTDEDKARIWNGGPGGWRRASTIQYWTKVQKELRRH